MAIYGRITAKEQIAMMQLILMCQRKGPRLVKCVFDEWWLWKRRWQIERIVPYSSINEFRCSVWKNGERKKSQCIWFHTVEVGEFAAGEMCVSIKASMRMLAVDEDELVMVALFCSFCECVWMEMSE